MAPIGKIPFRLKIPPTDQLRPLEFWYKKAHGDSQTADDDDDEFKWTRSEGRPIGGPKKKQTRCHRIRRTLYPVREMNNAKNDASASRLFLSYEIIDAKMYSPF